jgi:hypothetical protein
VSDTNSDKPKYWKLLPSWPIWKPLSWIYEQSWWKFLPGLAKILAHEEENFLIIPAALSKSSFRDLYGLNAGLFRGRNRRSVRININNLLTSTVRVIQENIKRNSCCIERAISEEKHETYIFHSPKSTGRSAIPCVSPGPFIRKPVC